MNLETGNECGVKLDHLESSSCILKLGSLIDGVSAATRSASGAPTNRHRFP
jgi:hypothetical protein